MNNLKTKADDLDFGKLKTIPVNMKKVNDVVDNEVAKNRKFNTLKAKVKSLKKNISDVTILVHTNQYNTDK